MQLNVHFFRPTDSIGQIYYNVSFEILKTKHSRLAVMLDTIKKRTYQNTWKTAFVNRANLCWYRIQTWSLIFESLFYMYFIRQVNIESHKNYKKTQRAKNHCVSCTPLSVHSLFICHRTFESSCLDYLLIKFKPSFSIR